MSLDLRALGAAVGRHGTVARVVVLRASGSVPRGVGTAMLVWAEGQDGTIGGGALEWEAMRMARDLLSGPHDRAVRTLALGPALGQCCGGSVTLLCERFDGASLPLRAPHARAIRPDAPPPGRAIAAALSGWQDGDPPRELDGWVIEGASAPARPLWIWGAGHVGRALVAVLAPLQAWQITWADIAADRFPDTLPPGVTMVPAADLARLAAHAPVGAAHLIVTLSHDTDLGLCHALLTRGFDSCGLIGSASKRARFRSRLAGLGHAPDRIDRIECPIGNPVLGKHPQAIAVGVAAALLLSQQRAKEGDRAG